LARGAAISLNEVRLGAFIVPTSRANE